MAFSGTKGIKVTTTEGDELTGVLFVKYLRWVSPGATAGDVLTVKDKDGNVLFASVADGSNFIDMMPIKEEVNGVDVDTLDSGTVFVHLGSPATPRN